MSVLRLLGVTTLLGSLTFTGSAVFGGVASASPTPPSNLTSVARNFHFSVAGLVLAPKTSVHFVNVSSTDAHMFIAANLGACSGKTQAQVIAILDAVGQAPNPPAEFAALCPGGSLEGQAFAPPLHQNVSRFHITPGRSVYFCPLTEPDGTPHYKLGMIGFFTAPGFVVNP